MSRTHLDGVDLGVAGYAREDYVYLTVGNGVENLVGGDVGAAGGYEDVEALPDWSVLDPGWRSPAGYTSANFSRTW